MKKSITILGAFALLIAAPSFSQKEGVKQVKQLTTEPASIEKTEEASKKEVKMMKVEKAQLNKAQLNKAETRSLQNMKAVESKLKEEEQ